MFDTKIEKCKKDTVKLKAQEQDVTQALKRAQFDEDVLNEALALGSSSVSEGELGKAIAKKNILAGKLQGTRSLIDKANQALYQALTEQRQSDEAEMAATYKSITVFRKDSLRELVDVLIEAQVLANLARGECFGTDLLHTIDFLFQAEPDKGPAPYNLMLQKIETLTKERYQESPMAKKDILEARINSHKELSIIAEADKLLSAALEEAANTTKEDSDVTGK